MGPWDSKLRAQSRKQWLPAPMTARLKDGNYRHPMAQNPLGLKSQVTLESSQSDLELTDLLLTSVSLDNRFDHDSLTKAAFKLEYLQQA